MTLSICFMHVDILEDKDMNCVQNATCTVSEAWMKKGMCKIYLYGHGYPNE
jgi:hypothetical protein